MGIQENGTAEKAISDVIPLSYNGKTMHEGTVTVRLSRVDARRIDEAVENGFFTNRSDFIRTAVRNLADGLADIPRAVVEIREDARRKGLTHADILREVKTAGREAHKRHGPE